MGSRQIDGTIERYMTCLIVKGYTQQLDYKETFLLIVNFTSIFLILIIVVYLDLELHQMSIKTNFLNGELNEEIYMQ